MKKIVLAAAFLAASVAAGAQNMYDAINFSQNHYFGTARSMAMGNAVTAVGGDLGSIGINPAGSAVAGAGAGVSAGWGAVPPQAAREKTIAIASSRQRIDFLSMVCPP